MPNVLIVWRLYQMYGTGTGTSHGLLRDTVSDLIIKGERLGQLNLDHSVTYPLVLGNQFREITLEVNTRILEGTNDWTN